MFARYRVLAAIAGLLLLAPAWVAAQSSLPIGAIQGAADVSPYLNRFVNFSGVVIGRYEDENTRGDVYYTLFVQDAGDDDPATSDGIAVFLGRADRPDIPLGARVNVGGKVTEFFGLTEIDDNGLVVTVAEPAGPLLEPVIIDPPAGMAEQATYFEALEGMRVGYDAPVVVAGPTHEGCGFAVTGEDTPLPAIRRADDDPVGRVVSVLYPSDLDCDAIPQVKTGDRVTGMAGALTYHFDQFKIVFDSAESLSIESAPLPPVPALPAFDPDQVVIASINLENYFDTARDTDELGEPVLSEDTLAVRQLKLAHVVAEVLHCPTLLAIQEVENEALLGELAATLAEPCGFAYQVSHRDSPDARGIDDALLSNPRRARVGEVVLRQTCSPVPTEITDPAIQCATNEHPLFGRPPLQVTAEIDGAPYTLLINHFKSKRGGEIETDLQRIHQAVFLNGVAAETLATDPAARVIALGDFNDTELSPALALLTLPAQGGALSNAMLALSSEARYTYNFGGVSELIDTILLSPAAAADVGWISIIHVNTDFPAGWRLDTSPERLPFRVSDHDIPVVVLGQWPATPTPLPTATEPAATIPPTAPPPTATLRPTAAPTHMPEASPPPKAQAETPLALSLWPAVLVAGLVAIALVILRARR
jgi:predicted extracellular nuclease